jgi:hypothetical protein
MSLVLRNIDIGLPSAASAGAAWSPPRQFEFDANVQRGMADRKAWGTVFSDPFVPHHVPHHHF